MTQIRVALDAFGGDNCPEVEIDAALACASADTEIILVGDAAVLERALRERGVSLPHPGLKIEDAKGVITMEDSPAKAVRAKPDASMPRSFDLVREGKADAVVSAGNSGAMLACGLFRFRRVKGVDRPAIITKFPAIEGHTFLLDMGANVECRPLNLSQFAVMGATYASVEIRDRKIRVGVLSNGTESSKGTELTRATHHALQTHAPANMDYVGYVEAKDIYAGHADVIVTDGYTGNIALKVAEGSVQAFASILRQQIGLALRTKIGAWLTTPAFRGVRKHVEPDNYGGAPLLGVRGVAIISHGSSSAAALVNAVAVARRCVEQQLTPKLENDLAGANPMFEELRNG